MSWHLTYVQNACLTPCFERGKWGTLNMNWIESQLTGGSFRLDTTLSPRKNLIFIAACLAANLFVLFEATRAAQSMTTVRMLVECLGVCWCRCDWAGVCQVLIDPGFYSGLSAPSSARLGQTPVRCHPHISTFFSPHALIISLQTFIPVKVLLLWWYVVTE